MYAFDRGTLLSYLRDVFLHDLASPSTRIGIGTVNDINAILLWVVIISGAATSRIRYPGFLSTQ
jgi:hypothetical protein